MTWVQLCTTERQPSLLMDGQQSSIMKATHYVFQQTWQQPLTTNNWQPTNNKHQTTTDNQQLTTYNRSRNGRDHLMGQRSHLTARCWANISFFKQHFFELIPAISKNCDSSTSVQLHPYKSVMLGQFVQRRPRLSFCFCCSSFTIGLLASSEMCRKI